MFSDVNNILVFILYGLSVCWFLLTHEKSIFSKFCNSVTKTAILATRMSGRYAPLSCSTGVCWAYWFRV